MRENKRMQVYGRGGMGDYLGKNWEKRVTETLGRRPAGHKGGGKLEGGSGDRKGKSGGRPSLFRFLSPRTLMG